MDAEDLTMAVALAVAKITFLMIFRFVGLFVVLEAERLFSLVCTNMEKRIILQTSMVRYRCQLIFEIMKNIFDYQNQFKFLCTNHVLNMPFI